MPRIRMLKPDHRLHRKVGTLDDATYRLWVSLIMESDDEGRFVCNASQLLAQTWGLRSGVAPEAVQNSIRRLRALRLIALYNVNGVRYGHFPSWYDHQKPKYPTPSKLPIPPGLGKSSPKSGEPSPNPPPALPSELNRIELNRTELNRTEGNRGNANGAHAPEPTPDEHAKGEALLAAWGIKLNKLIDDPPKPDDQVPF